MGFAVFVCSAFLGIVALQQQPALGFWQFLPLAIVALLSLAAAGFCFRLGAKRFGAMALLALAGGAAGFAYAGFRAEARLAGRLPAAWEGADIALSGRIASLPSHVAGGVRFEFAVEAVQTPGAKVPPRILLSAYEGLPADAAGVPAIARFRAGERWAFTVRLKRPRGQANPGGFDYAAWLLEKGLGATGTVRMKSPMARKAGDGASLGAWILGWREQIRGHFLAVLGDAPYAGVLAALAVGDQKSISPALWQRFGRTGTTHLMSISGLHISLAALLAGFLANRLWRRFPRLCLALPAQKAALWLGFLAALGYALLAGFGIPAQRAVLMLGVAALAQGLGRGAGAARALLLALFAVLLADPWAVLAPGFWLSFGAVAGLLWAGSAAGGLDGSAKPGVLAAISRFFRNFSKAQWAASLATLPLLLAFFGSFPLAAPLANLAAIPVSSFAITPLALLAAALCLLCEPLAVPLLWAAHALVEALMLFLSAIEKAPQWLPPQAPPWAAALAAGGAFWLLVPCRMPGKAAAAAALLPLAFWPAPRLLPGELRLTMLDVGQGQSILLETARHAVLYDAGPAYPGSGTDAARQVALPYLARRGIGRLSALIVSHRDLDHAGGMRRVLEGLPVEARYGSWVDAEDAASPPMRLCQKGEGWEFDGVRFEFLHPRGESQPEGKNQDSCVLKVSAASGRALLAGDIGKKEEQALLLAGPGSLSAELLAMPHHGSRHSSSLPFLAAVGPAWSFASAGWGNRFGHPHPDALMRHEALGIAMRRTDHDGALTALFAGGKITVEGERQRRKRYWQD